MAPKVDEMHYDPAPFTDEAYREHRGLEATKDKGAWTQSRANRHMKSMVAYPKKKKILVYTSLRDPRIAYALSTSVKHIPELGEYELVVYGAGWKDENDVSIGTVNDVLKNKLRTVSGRSPNWSRDSNEVEYTEFKFEILEDVDDISWYHATSLDNLKSIMAKGLLSSKNFEQGTGWTQLNLHLQDAVYLTLDEDYALSIAETLVARTDTPGLVLKISGEALKDKERLVVDEDALRNQYDSMLSGGELKVGMPDYLSSVLHSSLQSIGYAGKIDPSYINPIYVVDYQRDDEDEIDIDEYSDATIYDWDEWVGDHHV